jgi:alkylation response protein AidB-like acyl-CoA dehydrogenase
MNFDYNEEQQLLADSVRRFLQKDYDFEARRKILAGEGWSPRVWAMFAEMGLLGLPLPADYGGFGGGAVDLMGVMEAFGEALVVEPYVATIMAARLVSRGAGEAQKSALLPALAEGRLKLAFAHDEKGARYRLDKVACTFEKNVLTGEKSAVLGAPVADKLVVSARTSRGVELFLADKPQMQPYRTIDGMLAADLVFRGMPAEPLQGGLAAIEEVVDFATALACAEAVGAMKFACDTTLEYLKTRKQFGVPIGTFQALQHRIVDMVISYEQAKSMACLACSKMDSSENAGDRARSVSMAKVKIADSARHVSQEAVQLHGGMGMSDELKVSHAFRRLAVLTRQFGDADYHLARFASL